jgi:hypothetical protein
MCQVRLISMCTIYVTGQDFILTHTQLPAPSHLCDYQRDTLTDELSPRSQWSMDIQLEVFFILLTGWPDLLKRQKSF